MKISIAMEDIEITIASLSAPTVDALVDAIIATRKGEKPQKENVRIFHKSSKLSLGKTLEEEGITDEVHLFTYIKKDPSAKKSTGSTGTAGTAGSGTMGGNPSVNPGMNQGMPGMGGYPGMNQGMNPNMPGMNPNMPPGMNPDMIKNILDDPNLVENSINMMMPGATEEQKQMIRQQFDMVKSNPELLNMAMSQMGGGMPGMGGMPPMGGMGYPMNQGYPGMNPMNQGMPPMTGTPSAPKSDCPPNGPCSHGYYPLGYIKDLESKLENLASMGFTDKEKNTALLLKHGGSVEAVIEELTK